MLFVFRVQSLSRSRGWQRYFWPCLCFCCFVWSLEAWKCFADSWSSLVVSSLKRTCFGRFSGSCVFGEFVKEFHRGDFANRTGLAQAWTVKSADRLFTLERLHIDRYRSQPKWMTGLTSMQWKDWNWSKCKTKQCCSKNLVKFAPKLEPQICQDLHAWFFFFSAQIGS